MISRQIEGSNVERKVTIESLLVIALYLILSDLTIELVGKLKFSEILLGIVFLKFCLSGALRLDRNIKVIVLSFVTILLGFVLSDIYNQSKFEDYSRGAALIISALMQTTVFYFIFKKNVKLINIFFIFSSVLAILNFQTIELKEGADVSQFKLFIGGIIPILVLSITYISRRSWKIAALTALIFGCFVLLFGARSSGLVIAIASLVYILTFCMPKSFFARTVLLLLIGFVSVCFYMVYVYLTINYFNYGNTISQISSTTNPFNPFELLYYGRSEFFMGLSAAFERPLLGYGAWASDELFSGHLVHNYEFIPAHSSLVTAWLWGGLPGLLGALSILGYVLSKVPSCNTVNITARFIYCFAYVTFFWDFLFSPIGHLRENLPVLIAMISVLFVPYVSEKR